MMVSDFGKPEETACEGGWQRGRLGNHEHDHDRDHDHHCEHGCR